VLRIKNNVTLEMLENGKCKVAEVLNVEKSPIKSAIIDSIKS
jgi:hypothetical protein